MAAVGACRRRLSASGHSSFRAAATGTAHLSPAHRQILLQQQQLRRSHSSPAATSNTTALKASEPQTGADPQQRRQQLPSFIKPRLEDLRSGIIEQLSGRDRIPAFMRMREAAGEAISSSPTMEAAARLYFDRGGKLFRPTIALLMASACNEEVLARRGANLQRRQDGDEVTTNQARIALIAEMIHVASLVHDDVIDEADTRRGEQSVSGRWGNKMAVLAGDFILARATQALCAIGDPTVIATMATIIEDLVVGEFLQMSPELSPPSAATSPSDSRGGGGVSADSVSGPTYSDRLALYLSKSERKTASLFANSCRSVALLADGADKQLCEQATAYGKNVGLAFQLVDDAIDYELEESESEPSTSNQSAGKPVAVDLEQGLITGPLLLAARDEDELRGLLDGRRSAKEIRDMVRRSGACERTRDLAAHHAEKAAVIATSLRSTNGASEALADLAMQQLSRRV